MGAAEARAQSDDESDESKTERTTETVTQSKTKTKKARVEWTVFVGLDAGNLREDGVKDAELYEPKRGPLYAATVSGTRYHTKWVLDLGLGWAYSRLKGMEPLEDSDQRGETIIATQAGYFEVAPRYRFGSNFEAGLAISQWVGPDLSYSSYSDSVRTGTFAAVDAKLRLRQNPNLYRIGARYLVDLTIPDRTLSAFMLALEFGLPVSGYDTIVKVTKTTTKETVQKESVVKSVVEKTKELSVTRFVLDPKLGRFQPGTANPDPASLTYFQDLAATAARLQGNYRLLSVRFLNPRLDAATATLYTARATRINGFFMAAGIPQTKIKTLPPDKVREEAQGTPLTQEEVEILFIDPQNSAAIGAEFNNIRKRYSMPDTCQGGDCK